MERQRKIGLAIGAAVVAAAILLSVALARERTGGEPSGVALAGEARQGSLTVDLDQAMADIRVRAARVPGRPIVVIDAGHGGRDPGAPGVSGSVRESALALAMARELADLLEARGRV
ncbi:MAG: N-acetylmuramoyl-L-alanine amidase family protein, partial [Sphingomicrobium sp.]